MTVVIFAMVPMTVSAAVAEGVSDQMETVAKDGTQEPADVFSVAVELEAVELEAVREASAMAVAAAVAVATAAKKDLDSAVYFRVEAFRLLNLRRI